MLQAHLCSPLLISIVPACPQSTPCPRGDGCPYAHNVFEYWLHPSRYRTQLCNDGTNCRRKVCFFAHTLDELRVPTCKPVAPELLALYSQQTGTQMATGVHMDNATLLRLAAQQANPVASMAASLDSSKLAAASMHGASGPPPAAGLLNSLLEMQRAATSSPGASAPQPPMGHQRNLDFEAAAAGAQC